MLEVACPNCGNRIRIAEENLSRTIRCKHCSFRFAARVTEDGQPPAQENLRSPRKEPATAPAGIPAEVGGFEIRGVLGEGAFGQVLLGYDRNLKRLVALKVPHPGTFATPKAIERFEREARAAALLRHPHIVPIYAAGHDGTRHYIASEFIPGPDGQKGRTLKDAIDAENITFKKAARIVRDLAEALAYAHEQGIVHRDVKSANVLMDAREKPHLTDFGLAHLQDQSVKITQDGAVLGTPAYMAPEQARGQKDEPLPASDQYSLGMVLYELLCGKVAFSGAVGLVISRQINEEPPSPRSIRLMCLATWRRFASRRWQNGQKNGTPTVRRWQRIYAASWKTSRSMPGLLVLWGGLSAGSDATQ